MSVIEDEKNQTILPNRLVIMNNHYGSSVIGYINLKWLTKKWQRVFNQILKQGSIDLSLETDKNKDFHTFVRWLDNYSVKDGETIHPGYSHLIEIMY